MQHELVGSSIFIQSFLQLGKIEFLGLIDNISSRMNQWAKFHILYYMYSIIWKFLFIYIKRKHLECITAVRCQKLVTMKMIPGISKRFAASIRFEHRKSDLLFKENKIHFGSVSGTCLYYSTDIIPKWKESSFLCYNS